MVSSGGSGLALWCCGRRALTGSDGHDRQGDGGDDLDFVETTLLLGAAALEDLNVHHSVVWFTSTPHCSVLRFEDGSGCVSRGSTACLKG